MPFLLLGIISLVSGLIFHKMAKKGHDHDGEVGSTGLILGGIILIVFYGLYYRAMTLFGN
jgi:hypothetical protein